MKAYLARSVIFLAVLPAMGASADDALMQAHDKAAAAAPEGVVFTLTLAKPRFHMGEPIGMTYAFSSTAAGKWKLDMGMYDRSGRLWEETFHVDPSAGTADPIADYFKMSQGFFGGGLRSMPPTLGDKPVELKFELNEWVRFDKPGKYRLYIEAQRISPVVEDTAPNAPRIQPPPAISNVVELEILPYDAAWSKGQLDEIRKALDAKADDSAASLRLRFLNSPESVEEMAVRLGKESANPWDLQASLIGYIDRKAALETLQKHLTAPDQPVTPRFLDTLRLLDVMLAEQGMPAPAMDMGSDAQKKSQDWWAAHQSRMTAALAKYAGQLSESLSKKEPAAKATCLQTLQQPPASTVVKPDPALAEALAPLFATLPQNQQIQALEYNWARTKTPSLLPTLLKLLDQPVEKTNDGLVLRDLLLARAYELDPKTVRPMILAEMKAPPSNQGLPASMHMRALLALPDETLPEMDETLAVHLSARGGLNDLEMTARLISRYGSKAIEPQVKAFYEPAAGRWACALQASLLAYFLRVDDAYGSEQFARCLASRQTGCWHQLFTDVGRQTWTPSLEKLAVEALANPSSDIVSSALTMLRTRGSADAKSGLLAALSQHYVPHVPTGRSGTTGATDDYNAPADPVGVRLAGIAETLANGHRWNLTPEEADQVRKLTLDANTAARVQALLAPTSLRVRVGVKGDGTVDASLNNEAYSSLTELKEKVGMFPPDTEVVVEGTEGDAAYEEFMKWAAEGKVKLKK